MKSEATAPAAATERSALQSGVRSHRWLADLEQAWLEAFGNTPRAPRGEEAPTEATPAPFAPMAEPSDTDMEGSVSSNVPLAAAQSQAAAEATKSSGSHDAAAPCASPRSAGSARRQLSAGDPALQQEPLASRLQQGSAVRTTELRSGEFVASSAMTTTAAVSQGASLSDVPTAAAMVREMNAPIVAVGPRRPPMSEAGASAPGHRASALAPRDFARRLMQVSGEEELQLNLRDASLHGEQPAAVARQLFQQLQATGMPLRRIYINGQRFVEGQVLVPLPSDSTDQE